MPSSIAVVSQAAWFTGCCAQFAGSVQSRLVSQYS
jgi:hypothetical protein